MPVAASITPTDAASQAAEPQATKATEPQATQATEPQATQATEPQAAPAAEPQASQASQQAALPAQPAQPPADGPPPISDEGLVFLIQDRLNQLGLTGGALLERDGKLDERTRGLIASYQERESLPVSGEPSPALLRHMEETLRKAR